MAAVGAAGSDDPLVTELYLVDTASRGIRIEGPFDGMGMRGNGSSPVAFRGVRVGADRRLGAPQGRLDVMLTATLPWFVLGRASCCVGLSGAAVELAAAHVTTSRMTHTGTSLAGLPTVRARLGHAKVRHMQARALLYELAAQLDAGAPEAQLGVLATAAYSRQLPLERLFRDARAAAVMAPTTDLHVDLLGRALTGQDLL